MKDPEPCLPLASLRREYCRAGLTRKEMAADPITQCTLWLNEAIQSGCEEPTAMALATVSREGQPSCRIVLLKNISPSGFSFYTNFESQKGRELAANPKAAATLFWAALERQVRICGECQQLPREQAVSYFHSRPVGSQLSAWVSQQSQPVPSRGFLEERLAEVTAKFKGAEIPLPPYWGGYLLVPSSVEFWQGRTNRLHDRLRYRRDASGSWVLERLAP